MFKLTENAKIVKAVLLVFWLKFIKQLVIVPEKLVVYSKDNSQGCFSGLREGTEIEIVTI